jgi:hypothetical protein
MVKNAVKELHPPTIQTETAEQPPRPTKAEQQRLINDAIGELLALVRQKTSHDVLSEKLEALYGLIQPLFAKNASSNKSKS